MSIITDLTRMWLTRTFKPFEFKNEYDPSLPFAECEGLGLYVHIPFCKSICNFCPYCKVKYSEALCNEYEADREQVSADVQRFIEVLTRNGFSE